MNLPNALTLLRLFLVPVMVVVLLTRSRGDAGLYLGTGIFGLAVLTDYLDGYLARRRNQVTRIGILLDPIADKLLTAAAFLLMCVNAYYAPYQLNNGDWENQKGAFLQTVVANLTQYAPYLPEQITHSQVITPLDLEREYGLTGGDIYHGQMGLDQLLMMRPIAGYGRYRSPVKNLFFCGAGAHPGGGVTGAPGYNAAREIIKITA